MKSIHERIIVYFCFMLELHIQCMYMLNSYNGHVDCIQMFILFFAWLKYWLIGCLSLQAQLYIACIFRMSFVNKALDWFPWQDNLGYKSTHNAVVSSVVKEHTERKLNINLNGIETIIYKFFFFWMKYTKKSAPKDLI